MILKVTCGKLTAGQFELTSSVNAWKSWKPSNTLKYNDARSHNSSRRHVVFVLKMHNMIILCLQISEWKNVTMRYSLLIWLSASETTVTKRSEMVAQALCYILNGDGQKRCKVSSELGFHSCPWAKKDPRKSMNTWFRKLGPFQNLENSDFSTKWMLIVHSVSY